MAHERLAARVRRVASGTGEIHESLTVFCPRLEHSVDLDTCTTCVSCRRITVDPSERGSYLMCDGAPETDSAPAMPLNAVDSRGPPIRDVMTTSVLCLRPDVSAETIAATFLDRGISGAPVVDADGRPVGFVSKTDLLRELGQGLAAKTAADIMIPIAFTLPELAPISMAAALMAYEGVHRIPIVADDGRVVGIVSALDILRWLAARNGYLVPGHAPTTRTAANKTREKS